MRANQDSELHKQGKMFGVLIVEPSDPGIPLSESYIAAFSAQLDGSYYHDGFVPPVYEMTTPPVGTSKAESQRLQRLLFANYRFTNVRGEDKNLLELFANEPTIVPAEEWFNKGEGRMVIGERIPPSGAGECCAPKLLQYAFTHGLKPVSMAEFWIGAPSKTEIRHEDMFYAPCSGKCVPILRHMLSGLAIEPTPQQKQTEELCRQIEILYEDAYLMVVNKPSGLLSTPGKGETLCLTEYLQQTRHYPFLQAAHRLDQDTSGIIVLAKTPEIYKTMQAYFQRRDILKRYESMLRPSFDCRSTVVRPSFDRRLTVGEDLTINLPLLPNPYDRPRQMVDKAHGKPSITRCVVRKVCADGTVLADFYPLTGRTHQLRVHAAHPEGLNAPIVGDRLYGVTNEVKIDKYGISDEAKMDKYGVTDEAKMDASGGRLMLHAAEIRFVHPITKEEMHFCIPSGFGS